MPAQLEYVDPNRRPGFFSRALAALANTRLGRFMSVHVVWKVDPFHNLQADPDVTFGGIPMRATAVSDEAERERLWALADRVFPPYAAYRRDAARVSRTIPKVQLTPREARRCPAR
jgi:hypothetical protein